MKIAFTTSGNDLNAPLDNRFGRAPKFLVYDLDQETFEVVDNQQNVTTAQGAGIAAAKTVAQHGANCLVTGYCGPNAYRALSAAGIKVFYTYATTVGRALEQYRSGKLSQA